MTKSYGSVGNGDHPVYCHPTLGSLDTFPPKCFRSSSLSQDSPMDNSESKAQQRRLQCLSTPATLHSPLLRRHFSSPGDKMKRAEHMALPQSYDPSLDNDAEDRENTADEASKNESFLYYIIYAFVNSVMCLPCLYGYAAVIFNHSVFQPHINALSKLVIFSSVIHQACFSIFSSLPFSIGQVQDAGLIFLSTMSNKIANKIIEESGGDMESVAEEVLSTTIVLLGLSTASLGIVLILMGKFRLADVVAYLPLPVVGGYLAFIGYFCLEAGVALCISGHIMKPSDWIQLFDKRNLLLAIPGIVAGIGLTAVARKCQDEAMLPISMVMIPVVFYFTLFFGGLSISDAREQGWVGETSPPVPVTDLFHLVDFSKVQWHLFVDLIPIWAGMTFVVSFSSCLDVAAISMDMGQALDTNNELMTVGISNFVSGLFGGFTGSYIFSQTLFTYRTGCTSRWIGVLVGLSFLAVVISQVNFLEITPLFFLGSTLIFIGLDLMYEWIDEVRHKLLLSEYLVLLATFVAIQFLGISGGIGLGIIVAIFDFMFTAATGSSVAKIHRRSLALYGPTERAFIENNVYNVQYPKILILEVRGAVFFGSSIQVLSNILDAAGIDASIEEKEEISQQSLMNSPRIMSPASMSPASRRMHGNADTDKKISKSHKPRFLVLDLSSVSTVDASAARGCFLQIAKMCAVRGIVVCAAGCNSRIDWIMVTHDCASHFEVREVIASGADQKIILFGDLNDALQFCEKTLVTETMPNNLAFKAFAGLASPSGDLTSINLTTAFIHYIGVEPEHAKALEDYEKSGRSFHVEEKFKAGETIFSAETNSDGFYIVLSGCVVVLKDGKVDDGAIFSGAGKQQTSSKQNIAEKNLSVGRIFGFVDFVLQRPRTFSVVAGANDTIIAKCHRDGLDSLKAENHALSSIVDKVLLLCSVVELASKDRY